MHAKKEGIVGDLMKECFAFGGQGKEKREVGGVFLLYLFGPEGGEVS